MTAAFGEIIKEWRSLRRFSQLQLSLEADISARHVSFLESGRAKPSRTMVVKLADALHMPKEIANQAMNAAGFTPVFPQLPMDDEALSPVHEAVSLMLSNHHPLPAMAIDRHWDIVDQNAATQIFFEALGISGATNMLDALGAAGEAEIIENWEEIALLTLTRLRAEIIQHGGDRILEGYAAKTANHPRLANFDQSTVNYSQAVIPIILNLSGNRLSLFSTIAQFGSVREVSASDIRVEMMFPADNETRDFFKRFEN